ncbi:MAG TPA: isoamylase early set domain-containing protein [Acidimicrobiia bacterium]|jgi:1,4-alpha-glucan branching enzyme|nr:isoamylase early set domain-containing protein [Acidimicrobiia bacterium]
MLTKRFFKTKNEVEVTFQVDRPDVETVEWVAEATGWEPVQMKRANRGKGPHKLRVRLPKEAAIQFRYIFDGQSWENDEAADAYWPNDYGSDNSVVTTTA